MEGERKACLQECYSLSSILELPDVRLAIRHRNVNRDPFHEHTLDSLH